MKIEANTDQGRNTKIFYADGSECELPIKSYDTETGEIEYYDAYHDENGKLHVKMTEWVPNHATGKMERKPIVLKKVLEKSYALVNGKKV